MAESPFDGLTRSLGRLLPRRLTLGPAATATGALLALVGVGNAGAKDKRRGDDRKGDGDGSGGVQTTAGPSAQGGRRGKRGPTGPTGPTGPAGGGSGGGGDTGPTGPQGIQGPTGAQGASGTFGTLTMRSSTLFVGANSGNSGSVACNGGETVVSCGFNNNNFRIYPYQMTPDPGNRRCLFAFWNMSDFTNPSVTISAMCAAVAP